MVEWELCVLDVQLKKNLQHLHDSTGISITKGFPTPCGNKYPCHEEKERRERLLNSLHMYGVPNKVAVMRCIITMTVVHTPMLITVPSVLLSLEQNVLLVYTKTY